MLILDTCEKTVFSSNNKICEQVHGVIMLEVLLILSSLGISINKIVAHVIYRFIDFGIHQDVK